MRALLVRAREPARSPGPAVLWIHGGGFYTGMPSMVWMSPAPLLAKYFGAVILSPAYRLSSLNPYPSGFNDCATALRWLARHAEALGARSDQIVVGGESAGGGLAAALCMCMRDTRDVKIAFQTPLYPMLDDRDTPSSRDNHARVWNTKHNHWAWKRYLKRIPDDFPTPSYAAPARQTDYSGLPPFYSFVCTDEPFLCETLRYAQKLRQAGVPAVVDVYDAPFHAFDMLRPHWDVSRLARRRFYTFFETAVRTYFAPQESFDLEHFFRH